MGRSRCCLTNNILDIPASDTAFDGFFAAGQKAPTAGQSEAVASRRAGRIFAAGRKIPPPARTRLTHRRFTDQHGKTWDVWQVHPAAAERRFSQRRVHDEDRTDAAERRSGLDRREERLARALIAPEFAYGWLCFETQGEKRRLAPVPDRWDSADDETIEQWCCVAKPVVRRASGALRREGGDQKQS